MEPLDPNYQPPPAFAPPEQRPDAQVSPIGPYPAAYGPAYPDRPPEFYYGFPPAAQEPTRRPRGRRNLVIVGALVAVLAVTGVAVYLFSGGSTTKRLPLPQSFAGYAQEHDDLADRLQSTLQGMLSGLGGVSDHVFDSASIGVYQADADVSEKAIVLALPSSAIKDGTPDQFASSMLTYMGNAVSEYPTGPHGGSLRCARTAMGAAVESGCAWSDPTTTGMIVAVHAGGAPPAPQALSTVTLALQDQID